MSPALIVRVVFSLIYTTVASLSLLLVTVVVTSVTLMSHGRHPLPASELLGAMWLLPLLAATTAATPMMVPPDVRETVGLPKVAWIMGIGGTFNILAGFIIQYYMPMVDFSPDKIGTVVSSTVAVLAWAVWMWIMTVPLMGISAVSRLLCLWRNTAWCNISRDA